MIVQADGAREDGACSDLQVQRRNLLALLTKCPRPRDFDHTAVRDLCLAHQDRDVPPAVQRDLHGTLTAASLIELSVPPELVFAAMPKLEIAPNGAESQVRARGLAIIADAILGLDEPTHQMNRIAQQCAEAALVLGPQDPGVQYVAMATRYRAGESRSALHLGDKLSRRFPTHTLIRGYTALLEFRLARDPEARVKPLANYLGGLDMLLTPREPSSKLVRDYLSLLCTGEANPRLGRILAALRSKYKQLEGILGAATLNTLCQQANDALPARARRPLEDGLAFKPNCHAWSTVLRRA